MNKYILLVSAIIAVAFASFASVYPLGVANQGEVSGMFDTLITPATYTFSIWSIIYATWIALGIYYFLKGNFVKNTNLQLLAGAQILSSLWLVPSQYLYIGTSFVVMLGVLALLLKLFFASRGEEKYFRYTVELFLGWIIVASLANLHLMLVSFELYPIPVVLTLISLLLGLLVNIFFIEKYESYIPTFVFVWAGIGIILGQENIIVQSAAGLSIVILIVIALQHKFLSQK